MFDIRNILSVSMGLALISTENVKNVIQYLPSIIFCSSQELNGMIVQEKIVESKQQKKQIEEV